MMTVRKHWPEYAIEAWALGMFMLSAAAFAVVQLLLAIVLTPMATASAIVEETRNNFV